MGIAQTGFRGAGVKTVSHIYDQDHPHYGGPNLEVLDAGGVQSIQKMTDLSGDDVLVLSIADRDKDSQHFVFKNMSGIDTPIKLMNDIVLRSDIPGGNPNYGGVEQISATDLQDYTAVPNVTNVDPEQAAFSREVVAEMHYRYNPPKAAATPEDPNA